MADTTDEIKPPNMDYINMLKESAKNTDSIVCMGLDPVAEAIPIEGTFGTKVYEFHKKVYDRMIKEGVRPGAFKLNHGFFESHDIPHVGYLEGTYTLRDLIFLTRDRFPGIPIILDFKRGDILKSSANYAKVGANNWAADAMTVAPYMGTDSVMPFVKTGKGIYVLDRTSNDGGADFQNLRTIKKPDLFAEGLMRLVQENIENGDAKFGSL
jgi:orotidine-5'-phosphate decarboxylase